MPQIIKLATRQLVEFLLRSGDIDNRFSGHERAAEGSRLHRHLQKAAGENYEAEVFLSHKTCYENFTLQIEGRADGVLTTADGVWIDEIKSTLTPLDKIDENYNELHWAQAKCYGYMYCEHHNLSQLGIQLTYINVETNEIKRLQKVYMHQELKDFYSSLLLAYHKWAQLDYQWQGKRDCSIKKQPFPFTQYRPGQRHFAVAVYKTIANGGVLFAQAPTGIGKTISTLFPAVKALGEGEAKKIFYLTAKTSTAQIAAETADIMYTQGLQLRTVTITAKDKVCFLAQRDCNPLSCHFAKGHYDRINEALFTILQQHVHFTPSIIAEYAEKYIVCPFELTLELTLWCDCIICDYNYLFDPQVYLRRFFTSKDDYIFLVDEAHNLVDRARAMYSAVLSKTAILQLRKQVGKEDRQLYRLLGKINKTLVSLCKICTADHYISPELPHELVQALSHFINFYAERLKEQQQADPDVLQLYFTILSFLKIADLYDEHYLTLLTNRGNELTVKLLCLDPSALLQVSMKKGKATIFFSATLTPYSYFMQVLGGTEKAHELTLPSPYEPTQLCLLIVNNISTKYKNRAASVTTIADYIYHTVKGKVGNYLVYFPSYEYLHAVYNVFTAKYAEIQTLCQSSEMDEQARTDFLASFDTANTTTLVGFCVLGGIYAEGIDLKGERLSGAIIVGVGLPQLNTEHNIIRDYYQQHNHKGFEYAYLYPGMNKVLQAAGRVIRTEKDKGLVLLIDERFTTSTYRKLFPAHWQHYRVIRSLSTLQQTVAEFW